MTAEKYAKSVQCDKDRFWNALEQYLPTEPKHVKEVLRMSLDNMVNSIALTLQTAVLHQLTDVREILTA